MSTDHNYAGPDICDSVVEKGEKSTSLEPTENSASESDHVFATDVENHNSIDCSAGSKHLSQDHSDWESGDVVNSKLEGTGENSVVSVNNNSVEQDDNVDDKLLVDKDSEKHTEGKENVLENETDDGVDKTDEANVMKDNGSSENGESCTGEGNMNVTDNCTEVDKSSNIDDSKCTEKSELQNREKIMDVTESSSEEDISSELVDSKCAEKSELSKSEDNMDSIENNTQMDKSSNLIDSKCVRKNESEMCKDNMDVTESSTETDKGDLNLNNQVESSSKGEINMAVSESSMETDKGDLNLNNQVESSSKGEINMDVTESSTETDKGDLNLNNQVESSSKGETNMAGSESSTETEKRGQNLNNQVESSNKGEINMAVSDNDDSSTSDLIMDIGDADNEPDEDDASDDESESEDEHIILLSPVAQDVTECDNETVPESAVSGSCDAEKSVETNNNCLTDKLSLAKPVSSDKKSTDEDTKNHNVGEGNKRIVKTDGNDTSETTGNTDSRTKFDDDAMESGNENDTSTKEQNTTEIKQKKVQASVDNSDADSVDTEKTAVKVSVGRKRKKPAAFEEFLTNDDEINEEVKKNKRLDGDSETPRRGRISTAATSDIETLLAPFKHGWMRELVYRSTGNTACDTYYFAPEGKKLRSLVQVAEYLEATDSPLSVNNFSFSRKVLHKPPFEVVRQAGRVGIPSKKGSPSPLKKSKQSPKLTPKTLTPKTLTPNTLPRRRPGRPPKKRVIEVPEPKSQPTTKFSDVEVIIERDTDEVPLPPVEVVPKVTQQEPVTVTTAVTTTTSTPVSKNTKTVTTSSKNVVLIKQEQNIDFNISALLNSSSSVTSSPIEVDDLRKKKMVARKSTTPRPKLLKVDGMNKTPNNSVTETTSEQSTNQLCTLACPGLEGRPPTLQCASCICLFHPRCVNYKGSGDFFCYICIQTGKKSTVTTPVTYKQSVVFGIPNQSTATTSVAMDIQSVTSQAVHMIYQSQASSASLAPSLYTLKLAPNNGLVSDGLIPSLQHVSSPSIVNLTTLHLPESVSTKSALRTALDKKIQSPNIGVCPTLYKPSGMNTSSLTSTAACTSVSSTIPALPTLISAAVLSVNNADVLSSKSMSKVIPAPPRLTLAPGVIPPTTTSSDISLSQSSNVSTSKSSNSEIPLNAQLLTLPKAVTKRLKLSQPLALKINNIQVVVPPSCVIGSSDGLKVLLPPNTFPLPTDPNQKLSVTVSNNTDPEVNKLTEPFLQSPSRTNANKSETNKRLSPGSTKKERKKKGIDPSSCFIKNLYGGYDCMLEIFKYLKTADLLRASCVCRTWKQIAKQSCLWRSISLRGLTITDWDKATVFFKNVRLESLSLMGMCHGDDRNKTWHKLMSNLHNLTSLITVEFGLVPAAVLHMVCEKLPGLEVFRAEFISDASGDQMWNTPCKTYMGKFASLKQLRELKLRGIGGLTLPTFSFSGGLTELGSLEKLISLSLTTLRSVSDNEFHFLREMKQLKELELGDCTNWSSEIYFILGELTNLTKLRLECGGEIPDIGLADMLVNLKNLEVLELIMFQIADTFENALGQLEKLHTLVIWPDATTETAAAVNSSTLAAVSKLKNLKHLEWGVVSSESASDNSGTEKPTEYIPILPQSGNQTETSDMALLSERISIIKLTEKLCVLLPQVSIRVFNTKVVPHSHKNGSS